MKNIFITIVALLINPLLFSQSVGIDTTNPNPDSLLEVWSEKKGVLLTNSSLDKTDLADPLLNHVEGMITYNTNESGEYNSNSVHDGLYYNDGAKWNFLGPNAIIFGDLKYSSQSTDHNGWYILDGRNINTLSSNAKDNAISLGLTTNLYNANDCFIKSKLTIESIGSINGTNYITLTQSNLPNITFNGTTSINGDHGHEYSDQYSPTQSLGLATNVLALLPLINVAVGRPEIFPSNNFASEISGNHSHSVSVNSGGNGTQINATPKHLVTNIFIYLGE